MARHVACIGAGFVGGPFGSMIAYQCPDTLVTVVDKNQRRIDAWNSDCLPMYEPGMEEILASIRQRPAQAMPGQDGDASMSDANGASNLRFSGNVEDAIRDAEIIVLCIDTPTKSYGAGKGVAADLSNIQAAVRTIAQVATTDKIVVEKSTVPCGTAELIRDLLEVSSDHQAQFEVLSNPEFLSEGSAINNLLHPSRVLIGSQQTPSGHRAAAALAAIYEAWVPRDLIKTMDCWSSELSKLGANAMLAQRLSSINSLSAICEAVGGDIESVYEACALDPRIGRGMLRPGAGWGGGCFQKDILDLVYIARSLGLDTVANYWMAVIEMNDDQKARFLRRIISCMHGSVARKPIAILGFSFKKNTSDTKNSPVIPLVQGLLDEGAHISIYDPMVPSTSILAELASSSESEQARTRICKTAYEACDGAEAVVVGVDWDEFQITGQGSSTVCSPADEPGRCLTPESDEHVPAQPLSPSSSPSPGTEPTDWNRIAKGMQQPKLVFDSWNYLPGDRVSQLGCRYVRIGRRSESDAAREKRYPFLS